jgi:hypothetical protein
VNPQEIQCKRRVRDKSVDETLVDIAAGRMENVDDIDQEARKKVVASARRKLAAVDRLRKDTDFTYVYVNDKLVMERAGGGDMGKYLAENYFLTPPPRMREFFEQGYLDKDILDAMESARKKFLKTKPAATAAAAAAAAADSTSTATMSPVLVSDTSDDAATDDVVIDDTKTTPEKPSIADTTISTAATSTMTTSTTSTTTTTSTADVEVARMPGKIKEPPARKQQKKGSEAKTSSGGGSCPRATSGDANTDVIQVIEHEILAIVTKKYAAQKIYYALKCILARMKYDLHHGKINDKQT